jgi:hypothetical protein
MLVKLSTIYDSKRQLIQSFTPRNRNAFAITDTELKLIAALAIIGLNSHPKTGYSTPAAIGIPSAL